MVFLDFWYINNIVRIPFSVGVFFFRTQLYEFPNTWGVRCATLFFGHVQKSRSSYDFVKRIHIICFAKIPLWVINTIWSNAICIIQSRVVKEKELTFYCTRSFHTLDTFFDNITSTSFSL
jgi:hypothetical protein